MEPRRANALEIALQTRVLETCAVHNEIFYDDEVDPSGAFALAVELVRQQKPYVDEFEHDAHALTDLLSEILSAVPRSCPHCASAITNPGGMAGKQESSLALRLIPAAGAGASLAV
jgi:hypothetical protein